MSDPGASDDLWVFAYGSLLWAPGFDFEDCVPARLEGWHRAFCIKSIVHRGTPERPGLVMGLVPGGTCEGRVYRIASERREETLRYLRGREQVTNVYLEKWLPVHRLDRPGEIVERAFVLVADPGHVQYAGDLPHDEAVKLILQGDGPAGSSRAYLESTWAHLEALGIDDPEIRDLAERLRAALAREAPAR